MRSGNSEDHGRTKTSRRMQFRIGINQRDVVVDDARVFGDGVNIAARLEAIAEPGGICISDKVQQEIRGKLALRFEDLGPQQLKNIPELVRVYRINASQTYLKFQPPRAACSSLCVGYPRMALIPPRLRSV